MTVGIAAIVAPRDFHKVATSADGIGPPKGHARPPNHHASVDLGLAFVFNERWKRPGGSAQSSTEGGRNLLRPSAAAVSISLI